MRARAGGVTLAPLLGQEEISAKEVTRGMIPEEDAGR